jgi:hypothetical protein
VDGILSRRLSFCHTARGRGSRCLVFADIGIWTPSRKSEVAIRPIHYVLVLKASERVSGAYERIGLTTGWEQWSLHSQEKDFDIV